MRISLCAGLITERARRPGHGRYVHGSRRRRTRDSRPFRSTATSRAVSSAPAPHGAGPRTRASTTMNGFVTSQRHELVRASRSSAPTRPTPNRPTRSPRCITATRRSSARPDVIGGYPGTGGGIRPGHQQRLRRVRRRRRRRPCLRRDQQSRSRSAGRPPSGWTRLPVNRPNKYSRANGISRDGSTIFGWNDQQTATARA